jgi:hypothetical protein
MIANVKTKENEILFSEQKTLKGKGNNSKYLYTFTLTDKQNPAIFELTLNNKASFFKRAAYLFKIDKIDFEEDSKEEKNDDKNDESNNLNNIRNKFKKNSYI